MENPILLDDYLDYMQSIRGSSKNTVKEYKYDLINFLKFIKQRKNKLKDIAFDQIDISDIDYSFINTINLQDLHSYISFTEKFMDNHCHAKFRKVASLKSFFKYMYDKMHLIDSNPSYSLEYPKLEKRLPIYLTLEDAKKLLNTVLNDKRAFFRLRDYAIIMVFLNCGLRLSELISLDVDDIKPDSSIRIIGKGNKERFVFLNKATIGAINDYIDFIQNNLKDEANQPLFISTQNKRISRRAVQNIIEKRILESGLDPNYYTVHKLRHTAATLMYKYGNIDILTIKEVLGHENVATTQIYTHLDNEQIKIATDSNPLSEFDKDLV